MIGGELSGGKPGLWAGAARAGAARVAAERATAERAAYAPGPPSLVLWISFSVSALQSLHRRL